MKKYKTSAFNLKSGNTEEKRTELLDYFLKTWELEEELYKTLKSDTTFYLRPDSLRHPLIFYYGHTATFFINKLIVSKTIEKRICSETESVCAIGVDEMSWDDLNDENYNWPSVQQIKDYRTKAKELVLQLIETMPFALPITWDSPAWIILMGIEHARIHIETSSVLIRQLPLNELNNIPLWKSHQEKGEAPKNELITVAGGKITLGKEREHELYGWDWEYGKLETKVQIFSAAKYVTSNAEFLEFINDGGYTTEKWWTNEGREWKNYTKAQMPTFWLKKGNKYQLRQMLEIVDLPLNYPVEVNFLEADAFCRWKSEKGEQNYRLPSEEEWYQMYETANLPDVNQWKEAPGNINLEHFASTCPVDKFQTGDFFDLVGNVWQWTETTANSFPKFRVHPAYDDFSVPTFDGRHNMFKGGSWISTGNEASKHARFAFRRHFFQHAGFRYIKSDIKNNTTEPMEYYETSELIAQYCEAHYGKEYFGVANFPKTCAEVCLEYTKGKKRGRALDLGSATGRTSFELAKEYDYVLGLDFSARFTQVAVEMQENGKLKYQLPEQGELTSEHEVSLKELGLEATAHKAEFYQADACNMKPAYKGYDLLFAGNLIDRLYDPIQFLQEIHTRINQGGILIIASPYTWLEEHTEKSKWVGGYLKDGKPVSTFEGLKNILLKEFNLVTEKPFKKEFITRETQHKFQHSLSEFTVWERK